MPTTMGITIKNSPVSIDSRTNTTRQNRFPNATPPSVGKTDSGVLLEVADSLRDIAVIDVAGINLDEALQCPLTVACHFLGRSQFV